VTGSCSSGSKRWPISLARPSDPRKSQRVYGFQRGRTNRHAAGHAWFTCNKRWRHISAPDLRAILAEAFERAEPHATLVVPMAARKGVNLRTHLERIIRKAGHEPWPRLLQNLRASCETDGVEKYPSHVVATWLGHSPKVAAQHYLMSREHHFEDVVRGPHLPPCGSTAAATGPEVNDPWSAECCAAGSRTGSYRVAQNDRTGGHHSGYRGFCGSRDGSL
jgi:hypothetical protein